MSKPQPLRGKSRDQKRRRPHRKSCRFCADKVLTINYKDLDRIKYYLTDRGKIVPRRISGTCAKHQRALTTAIKQARALALVPYIAG